MGAAMKIGLYNAAAGRQDLELPCWALLRDAHGRTLCDEKRPHGYKAGLQAIGSLEPLSTCPAHPNFEAALASSQFVQAPWSRSCSTWQPHSTRSTSPDRRQQQGEECPRSLRFGAGLCLWRC